MRKPHDTMYEMRGQGLIEMIIAIGILTTGLLSALTLVASTLGAAGEGTARLIATNLAREGIEAVRATRDGNWFRGASWNEGLAGIGENRTATAVLTPGVSPWEFDFTAARIDDEETTVYLAGDGFYRQFLSRAVPVDAARSPYRRLITLSPICILDGGERVVDGESATCGVGKEIGLAVGVAVQWDFRGRTRSVVVEEKMYDWR